MLEPLFGCVHRNIASLCRFPCGKNTVMLETSKKVSLRVFAKRYAFIMNTEKALVSNLSSIEKTRFHKF